MQGLNRAVSAMAIAVAIGGNASGADRKPNVLFLFTDDQRPDAVAALGNPAVRTPNLDRLVASGLALSNAYCMGSMVGAVCLPSRTMLLSGRSLFHIREGGRAAYEATLPRSLRAAGYETYHHGKSGNSPHGIHADFEHTKYLTNDDAERRSGYPGKEIADAAIEFLAKRSKDRPFFLYLAFANPHDPRVVNAEARAGYKDAEIPLPRNYLPIHPFDNGEMRVRDEKLAPWPRTEAEIRRQLADYYGVITYLDMQIGRILNAVEETGEYQDTIIIFSSDHGLAMGSHGLMGKQNLYEHSMRSPLVISGPGIRKGRSEALVYLFDLFPTICELVGIEVPDGLDARSFAPVLRGEAESARSEILLAYKDVQRAARRGDWKLIRYPHVGVTQLFNLREDPDERRDLAGSEPERVMEMLDLLARLKERSGDPAPLTVKNPKDPAVTAKDLQGAGEPQSTPAKTKKRKKEQP